MSECHFILTFFLYTGFGIKYDMQIFVQFGTKSEN